MRTIDAAVTTALAQHDWAIEHTQYPAPRQRLYTIRSLRDETGHITITLSPPTSQPQAQPQPQPWWRIDPEHIHITTSLTLFPDQPDAKKRARDITKSITERLEALEDHGHAPIPE
ncbi:MAG: hypothetical protein ACTS3F_00335 [Phycisphaerales bacterium]